MRKIDKSEIKATKYDAERKNWGKGNTKYPLYSSKNRHYPHVKMNLLRCQNGLCPYTEQIICVNHLADENWINGLYQEPFPDFLKNLSCQIDHFDPNWDQSNGWEWDNLFAVDPNTNHKKNDKPVFPILKPDLPEYDTFELLAYDIDEHKFKPNYANENLTAEMIEQIKYMIDVLGINHPTVHDNREDRLREAFVEMKFTRTDAEYTSAAFPTAYEMGRRQLTEN